VSGDAVLGLGDSILEGPGDSALGVLPRPWAQWLALALDAPFHALARPGITAPELARDLLPRAAGRRYALACVGVGTNDVRLESWDAAAFAAALRAILDDLDAARIAVPTVPADLGRPRAGAKVRELNDVVRSLEGVTVVELEDLRGWRRVMPDAVHPTALGQLAIADRAAAALGLEVRPSALADPDRSTAGLARHALTRHAPMVARDVRRRLREGTLLVR
jgi:lysophospholipase L1-like esterase